jgi:thiamine biosynthesis lipoprotein
MAAADVAHRAPCEEWGGRVMASELRIVIVGGPEGLADRLHRELAEIERRWSRFLPSSDVTRINAADGGWVAVAPHTITLLATMLAAWRLTDGR